MKWKPDQPFNQIPRLPPEQDLETKTVLKQCVAARAALGELKQAAELIPNASMLINTLPMLEAKDSSEIENIVTTTDQLFRYLDDEEQADPATKEALRYRAALLEGFHQLRERPLNTSTAIEVCSRIKDTTMDVRKITGTTLANPQTNEVIYTPPVGEDLLRELLANWEKFLHNHTEIDPLIRMAAGHYQFEAIHPFTDGNGRTGRILNSLFLIQEELLTLPILYLSRYIIRHRPDYYRLLLGVTSHGEWEPWLLYMLTAVEDTARWTIDIITAIRSLAKHTANYIKQEVPKIYSRELIDIIFQQPYCRIHNIVDANIAKRQTASEYLKKLVSIGVLAEQQSGREKLYTHPKLLQLLTQENQTLKPYFKDPELKLKTH